MPFGTPRDATCSRPPGVGAFVYSVETVLAFGALERIDASLAELVLFTYPAIVIAAAVALRYEKLSGSSARSLALAMSGVVLVLVGGDGLPGAADLVGIAMAAGAAIFYAGYVLVAGRIGGRLHPLTFAAALCSGAAVAQLLAGAGTGTRHLSMGPVAWACAAALAIVSTVFALTAFVAGVARLGPSRAGILSTLEPGVACLLAFAVFGERLSPVQVVGGVLVVAAAVVLELPGRRRRARRTRLSPRRLRPAPGSSLAPPR